MKSTYSSNDVEILLKDITGMVEPLPAKIREKYIQSGTHYSEMLPLEYRPSEKYMDAYNNALKLYGNSTAQAVSVLAERVIQKKGKDFVLVSLARAGIPIGILLKRYLLNKYNLNIKHYAISIIRGKGIDQNAMNYILSKHHPESIQFIDGWTGKGAILRQLEEALSRYDGVDTELGVLSDPANITNLCGTHEDILIPSSCLNATVTGLISRTFLRDDIISPYDFHGAVFYEELRDDDLSIEFIRNIEMRFDYEVSQKDVESCINGMDIVRQISKTYGVRDINFIKPGIGETTRVLLRRIPWKVIVDNKYYCSKEIDHIKQLAREKGIDCEVSQIDLGNYKVCGLIKDLSDV